MSERIFDMAFTAWSEAAERAEQTEEARLAAAGLEKRQCEICGDNFRREVGSLERRCDACRSLTCREGGAVALGLV